MHLVCNTIKKACKDTKNISRAQINKEKSEKKHKILASIKKKL